MPTPAKAFPVALSATLVAVVSASAHADDMLAITVIGDDAFKNASGVAQVSASAGDANLQANATIFALIDSGTALAAFSAVQRSDGGLDGATVNAIAQINDDAFGNAEGVILVSQGSGRFNLQSNSVAVALGIEGIALSDADLSQTRSDVELPNGAAREGVRNAHVGDRAFANAAGVVQVNQVAGLKNSTFNRFALGVSAGATP